MMEQDDDSKTTLLALGPHTRLANEVAVVSFEHWRFLPTKNSEAMVPETSTTPAPIIRQNENHLS